MCKSEIRIVSLLFCLLVGTSAAWAQILPPQTAAQRRLQLRCWKRAEAHLNNPFDYPLNVGSHDNPPVLGVFVDPERWKALPRSERVSLLRDVACSYAGGRMMKRYWYDFGAIDPASGRAIEVFKTAELWPKSGHYQ